MRRTQEGLQVHLEAEEGVPHQVADASKGEQRDTQQRDLIACWHGVFPSRAMSVVEDKGDDQDQGIHEIASVEHGMPGGEKGPVHQPMSMSPSVEVDPTDKDHA